MSFYPTLRDNNILGLACPHCHAMVSVPLRHTRLDDEPCAFSACNGRRHIRLHYTGWCPRCENEIIASFKV